MSQQSVQFRVFESVDKIPKHTYRFVFLRKDGSAVAAHSYTGLACSFIDGYADIDENDMETQFAARMDAMNRYALAMQFGLVKGFAEHDPEGFEQLTDEDMAYLQADKDEGGFTELSNWPHDNLPLILFATGYAPYVENMEPPTGNIVWVNPVDERRFVTSLSTLGLGSVFVDEDIDSDDDELGVEDD